MTVSPRHEHAALVRDVGGSFRDPSGRVFVRGTEVLRVLFHSAREDYEHLLKSGLYDRLVDKGLLVPHAEVTRSAWELPNAWRVLRPERIPFISYASEWCFSQLRDAAVTTLRVQREALRFGMTLKDASTSNIQFLDGRAVLIDILSLVRRPDGPWVAYYQFCKHFLAPLLLVVYGDPHLLKLLGTGADGIPLDRASRLLPWRSWLRSSALLHVHLHARARDSSAPRALRKPMSDRRMEALVDNLTRSVERLRWTPPPSEWTRYEKQQPTYTPAAWTARLEFVSRVVAQTRPGTVWDFGAATGYVSRMTTRHGAFTVAFDADPSCVELAYRDARQEANRRLLPLVQDLLRPTPCGGWAQGEYEGLIERGPADLVLALGLVHHLAVPGGIPLDRQLEFFAKVGRAAVIEWVPQDDPVVTAWANRFRVDCLHEPDFVAAATRHFGRVERHQVADSRRALYYLSNA